MVLFNLGKKRGYITLVSILIVSSVGLIVVFSSLSINIENIISISSIQNGKQSKALAEACAEIALNELKISTSYTGNQVRNLSFGTCTVGTISGTGNTNRSFQVSSSQDGYYFRINITVGTVNPNIIIQSWDEV